MRTVLSRCACAERNTSGELLLYAHPESSAETPTQTETIVPIRFISFLPVDRRADGA
ncbi:hypothetical protein [Paraburkholderia caballeronis]|uniref:hypothetical protein n=1 Tax=Paraburkholderia caballeronis TaxID=416943 RepID=UPI001FCB7013|nr:hypothetical protein [Paraburkholderia caballeronis]